MKDPVRARKEALEKLLAISSRQLAESAQGIEEIKSVMHWAKTPRDRTAMNIVLDDQKKVSKALERLVDDISEIAGQDS